MAWPAALGSWAINSGTSFSAPLLAGASALMMEARGKSIKTNLKSIFQQTAVPVHTTANDDGPIASLAQQGAGLINAYNAVNYKTFISPSILALNDTVNSKYQQQITIQNGASTAQTYTLSHLPAGTALTVSGINVNPTPQLATSAAGVTFSATSVTVPAGGSSSVTVTFTPPSGLDPSTFPVYSGQIVFTSSVETVAASYLGMAASIKSMQVLDTSNYCTYSIP